VRFLTYAFLCIAITILPSCAAVGSLLSAPMSVFQEDEETGELVEVETTVGDVIADQAGTAEGVVSTLLGANPALAAVGGAAAAALFGKARQRKKTAPEDAA
jgi:light-regulated signal transduction histidine kinase (bacteriophytochrome)